MQRQNPLQQAIQELGRLGKTGHILHYVDDPPCRRRVLVGLNKGETLHSLARDIVVGHQGRFPARSFVLYDALFRMGVRLFRESEEQIWKTSQPIWERLEAWFENRLLLAQEHPDLYHLVFDNPVPGFLPSPESLEEARKIRPLGVQAITEAMNAGMIAAPLTPNRVLDLLLAMRRGIIAEHLGKETHLPLGDDRFRSLIPEALTLLKEAWTPPGNDKKQSVNAIRLQPASDGELRRAGTTDS